MAAPPPHEAGTEPSTHPESGPPEQQAAVAAAKPYEPASMAVVKRPARVVREFDEAAAAAAGIRKYESPRLRLYTELAAERARELPPLVDQAYEAWEAYFGPLPDAVDGRPFQITGYLMLDPGLYVKHGLIDPEFLAAIVNGRHRGCEFWMREQPTDYFRRHLMLHEATHCFMTITPHRMSPCGWYMEGMAELFGAHRLEEAGGRAEFCVMPSDRIRFAGFARFRMLADEITAGRGLSVRDVWTQPYNRFDTNVGYAWSWGLCHFLNQHPRYQDRFRRISREADRRDPIGWTTELFADDLDELGDEWERAVQDMTYGYDVERAAIEFRPGRPIDGSAKNAFEVRPNIGWQSTAWRVDSGESYDITAEGRIAVDSDVDTSDSEADGITLRYVGGQPIGRLLGVVNVDRAEREGSRFGEAWTPVFPLGNQTRFTASKSGTLYVRCNDAWGELADNTGVFTIRLRESASSEPQNGP
jgi:hypothetical protein